MMQHKTFNKLKPCSLRYQETKFCNKASLKKCSFPVHERVKLFFKVIRPVLYQFFFLMFEWIEFNVKYDFSNICFRFIVFYFYLNQANCINFFSLLQVSEIFCLPSPCKNATLIMYKKISQVIDQVIYQPFRFHYVCCRRLRAHVRSSH